MLSLIFGPNFIPIGACLLGEHRSLPDLWYSPPLDLINALIDVLIWHNFDEDLQPTSLELLLWIFMLVFNLHHLSYSLDRLVCLFEHTSMGKVFDTSIWHSSLKVFNALHRSYTLGFLLLVSLRLSSPSGFFPFLHLFKVYALWHTCLLGKLALDAPIFWPLNSAGTSYLLLWHSCQTKLSYLINPIVTVLIT